MTQQRNSDLPPNSAEGQTSGFTGGRVIPPAGKPDDPVLEPGSVSRGGRPRDARFAAYYAAARKVWPDVTSERGLYLKARSLYAFSVLRCRAPELVAWFASGHVYKTKALAALSRFDEPSIVLVARQIVAEDMAVLDAVGFCDLVLIVATAGTSA